MIHDTLDSLYHSRSHQEICQDIGESGKLADSKKRIERLKASIFPLTKPFLDEHGDTFQVWSTPGSRAIVAIQHSNGLITYVSRIRNALNRDDNIVTIHNRLLTAPDFCEWRFTPNEDGSLTIWPYILAGGWRDVLPRSQFDLSGLTRLARGKTQEQMCAWFYTNDYQANNPREGTRIEIHMDGQFAGSYSPEDHQTIRNLLRQGGNILAIHFAEAHRGQQNNFLGRGITFQHPSDRSESTFNVDFTRVRNEHGDLVAENEGGYHIDVRNPGFSSKVKISTRETYDANYEAIRGGRTRPFKLKAALIIKPFHQTLQQTGLTKSYNSSNPDHPAPEQGSTQGEIGGVGCSVEFLEGLFNNPEWLFETEHQFFIPEMNGEIIPCTTQELHQLLQELAVGIYVHDTIPFFSLHFNQDTNLYPVIHPAYQNTLVGQVISMLDYFMKGYLNGAVFKEEFVQQWQQNPYPIVAKLGIFDQMIDFHDYAGIHLSGRDQRYFSARTLLNLSGEGDTRVERAMATATSAFSRMTRTPPQYDFSDYTKFTNSFRIIAKQQKIEKTKELFVLHPDFDVFYTIEPDPEYKARLDEYHQLTGMYPLEYQKLEIVYDVMKERIHDHMTKMPFCRKYFAMLGLINFFSHYFMTLKKHRRFPILPRCHPQPAGSPSLFPSLPLLAQKEFTLTYRSSEVLVSIIGKERDRLKEYYSTGDLSRRNELKASIKESWVNLVWENLYNRTEFIYQHYLERDKAKYLRLISSRFPFDSLDLIESVSMRVRRDVDSYLSIPDLLDDFSTYLSKIIDYNKFWDGLIARSEVSLKGEELIVLLPSNQTLEDHGGGRKIVGGCGLHMEQHPILSSSNGPYILEHVKELLAHTSHGEWISLDTDGAVCPKGAVFKLAFDDLPLGILEDKEGLHHFLVGSVPPTDTSLSSSSSSSSSSSLVSPDPISNVLKIQRILSFVAKNDQEGFLREINDYSLQQLNDYQGRNLLHRVLKFDHVFFLKELLKRRISLSQSDHQGYLPIHYAAMYGRMPHLKILYEAERLTRESKSLQGATPLTVAIQHEQLEAVLFLLARGAVIFTRTKDGYSSLHTALHYGNEKIVLALLKQPYITETTVNLTTNEGITPLMLACESKNLTLVKALLNCGANPTIVAKNGLTALDIAVRNDDYPLCEHLFPLSALTRMTLEIAIKSSSLEINTLLSRHQSYQTNQNSLGDTPILMSLRYANIPVFRYLLDRMTDPALLNVKNRLEESPLELTAKGGFYEDFMNLLRKGAVDEPFQLISSLLKGGYAGQNDEINRWIKNQSLSEHQIHQLVIDSLDVGNHMGVSIVLDLDQRYLDDIQGPRGWKIEHYLAKSDALFLFRERFIGKDDYLYRLDQEGGKTLPYIAAENRSWRVLNFLLTKMRKKGIPFDNHFNERHLFYSIFESGDLMGIELLIRLLNDSEAMHIPLDREGARGTHLVAKEGSREVLEYLSKKGADFSLVDGLGRCSLYYAVRFENRAAMKFLLAKSLPISAEVIYAAAENKRQLKSLLLKGGINQRDSRGNSAILLAAKDGNLRAFLALLHAGASLEVKNRAGWSPLLYAAYHGNIEMIKLILSKIQNPQLDTIKGENALHIAIRRSHISCMRLLINHQFSLEQPNQNGVTARNLAEKFFACRAVIGVEGDEDKYDRFMFDLRLAIREQDLTEISSHLDEWFINTYFSITVEGKNYEGTLLHILLHFCADCPQLEGMIARISNREKFSFKLKDSLGNSYAHLMVKAGYDPIQIGSYQDLPLMLGEKNVHQDTPLHLAVQETKFRYLSNLVDRLIRIESPNETGSASSSQPIRMVRNTHLLDPINRSGRTPLFAAIIANNIEAIICLVDNGANLNHRDFSGITPLILACSKGNYTVARLLIQRGADINLSTRKEERQTALTTSLMMKNEMMALFLLFQGAKTDERKPIPLVHLAAKSGLKPILRFLAEKGMSLTTKDTKGRQPIHYAATAETNESLVLLKELGVSIHSKSHHLTPLDHAVREGTVDAVKWLLKNRANPLESTSELKILASTLINTPVNTERLLILFKKYLLSTDLRQIIPAIGLAIQRDYIEPLKLLYGLGIPIDGRINESEYSGLHLACKFGALQSTEFFLTRGSDCFEKTRFGDTPLEIAAGNKSVTQFRMMLNFVDYDVDGRNLKGETLLHHAVSAGNLAHVALLLEAGADLNLQDVQGQTPLFRAVEQENNSIVELLMVCGADSEISTSFSGLRPNDMTCKKDIRDIVQKYNQLRGPSITPLDIALRTGSYLAEKVCAQREIHGRVR